MVSAPHEIWALCRVIQKSGETCCVEIVDSRGNPVARITQNLSTRKALDFIVKVAQENEVLPHFHFEPGAPRSWAAFTADRLRRQWQ